MKTRNLTQDEARNAAIAAARISRRSHVVVQLRNGHWKWYRWGFWMTGFHMKCFARRLYYVSAVDFQCQPIWPLEESAHATNAQP